MAGVLAVDGVRYVRIRKFAEDSGFTENAVRVKIARGVWMEGREYRRAPDNSIMIDVEGVEKWVLGERAAA